MIDSKQVILHSLLSYLTNINLPVRIITLSISAPILLSIFGVFLWFLRWHGYLRPLNLKAFSVSFLLLALFLWTQIKGAEFGFTYFLISLSIIGLSHLVPSKHSFKNLITSINKGKEISRIKSKIKSKGDDETSNYHVSSLNIIKSAQQLLKSIFNLLLMILVPFFTAASISLLLPTALGIKEANTLVLSLFVLTISWSLLLTWVYMKQQRAIALGLLSFTSIIGFSTVYFTTNFTTAI